MLEAKQLRKEFNNVTAVDGISFSVGKGRIFGLIGPNGAGKTTTLRIILDIIKPSAGEIFYNGAKISQDFQNKIGYLPEERGLYKKSKTLDTLVYFAALKGMDKNKAAQAAKKWLKALDIESFAPRKIEELSKGNQQKIQFIAAFLHDPEIIILDEPFSGFDPVNQEMAKKVIAEHLNTGKIVILSTHQMDIAEKLCSDIFLINKGKEVLSGSILDIKKKFGQNMYKAEYEGDASFVKELPGVLSADVNSGSLEARLEHGLKPHEFLKTLSAKVNVNSFISVEPSLHNIFIQTVNQTPAEVI
jgi:ABC-2 type transport system ATP-binding protein